jgi:SAM-dependent methyltransferase
LIGCTPFWGVHFGLCWLVGRAFSLNRLKMYLAANVINPLVLPPLFYAEVQTGSLLRRGHFLTLSWDMLGPSHVWSFGTDLVIGSVIIGVIVGAIGGVVTYAARRPARDPFFQLLVRRASDRFLDSGITAWEFARGKLSGDPVYAAALGAEFAAATGTLLDIGCGQGLMLALVAEAQHTAAQGEWDTTRPDPPQFTRLIGVELRPRVARIAVRALEHEADVLTADARRAALPRADVVLLFDVLHMLPDDGQRELLRAIRAVLPHTGRVLVREADAAAGWRFTMVRAGNALKAILTGRWHQRFAFRSQAAWRRLLHEEGFEPHLQPMGEGTPFANVLISATVRIDGR